MTFPDHNISIRAAALLLLLFTHSGCSPDQITGPVCDGTAASSIGYWNGTTWSPMDGGVDGHIEVLSVDTATGDVLAGGSFARRDGVEAYSIARWSETTQAWEALGQGVSDRVSAIVRYKGEIIVGGYFERAMNADGTIVAVNSLARWDGERWHAVAGIHRGDVQGLLVVGDSLIVAGDYSAGDTPVINLGLLNLITGTWLPLGAPNKGVNAVALHESMMFVGGFFTSVGGIPARYFARYDLRTGQWSSSSILDSAGVQSVPGVYCLAVHNGAVYMAGVVKGDAPGSHGAFKWSIAGDAWEQIAQAPESILAIHSTGSELYFGGQFVSAGDVPAKNLARYDDVTGRFLSTGLGTCSSPEESGVVYSMVRAIASTDRGLYVGGEFAVLNP